MTEAKNAVVIRKEEVGALLPELAKMLPPTIPADKFVRTVQTAITLNPDLAHADKASVLGACMKAASDGLIPDGREGAIVVYKAKQKDGTYKQTAQWLPMINGIIKRARNSGEISILNAFVVHKNDKFTVRLGLELKLDHEPNYENPGEMLGAYAVVKYKDGEIDFEYMSVKQIDGIKARSKTSSFGPWVTDYEEMARKTVLRRLSKRLPMSADLTNVIQRVDEFYDMKENLETIDGDTGEVIEKNQKKRGAAADKLKDATVVDSHVETIAHAIVGESSPAPTTELAEDLNDIPAGMRD